MTEKQFQNKIINYLKQHDIYHIKIWGGGFQRAGVPDLIICYEGRFIAVELKSEIGQASELQMWNIDQIIKSGGTALVLRPSQFQKFKEILTEGKNV